MIDSVENKFGGTPNTLPTTPAPTQAKSTPTVEIPTVETVIKAGLEIGADIAVHEFPKHGTIIRVGHDIFDVLFRLWDALHGPKPPQVTAKDWEETLKSNAIAKSADDYLRDASNQLNSTR